MSKVIRHYPMVTWLACCLGLEVWARSYRSDWWMIWFAVFTVTAAVASGVLKAYER